MRAIYKCSLAVAALLIATSCRDKDNSASTDQASKELRKAQAHVSENSNDLAENQDQIEQHKRQLLLEQQELVDREKLLEQQGRELASAQQNLREARLAYATAVKERLAKLDASLATLATKTDAKSKDAVTGLRARRDQLAAKLDVMGQTPDPSWSNYTHDVDVMFDAIERDLDQSGE